MVRVSVKDTITMVLSSSISGSLDPAVALDVLDPVFVWSNGPVAGAQIYRVTVWDASENCYFWMENVPAGTRSITYGTVPAGVSQMMPTVDLVSGVTYCVSVTAQDVPDCSQGDPTNEIGFASADFYRQRHPCAYPQIRCPPISRAEFEKRLAALQGR